MQLRSAAGALPGAPVDNVELQARLGLAAEWVDRFVGTRTRHFAAGTADLADLCTAAALSALDSAGFGPKQLDFVVLATATPDALMPTTANVVADRLGVSGVPVLQIQSGCSGTVQALALAEALLATGARHGLVLGGDVVTKHFSLDRDFRRMPSRELVNYVLFGDGAGAAVVSAEAAPGSAACLAARHRPVLPGRAPGQSVEWYGAAERDSVRPPVTEDYQAVRQLVPELARQEGKELLGLLDWSGRDLAYLLPPQLGGLLTEQITAGLREALGADRAVEVSCVAETGNTGNALLLLQLERLLPRLAPGDRVLAVSVESSHWIVGSLALEGS
ncbi:3-oxoacyl-ACP synthase [Streptacidiphilus sp. PAMC 29251]